MKKVIILLAIMLGLSLSALASEPTVINALNYEKTVVPANYTLAGGVKPEEFGNHTIRIPKINLDTPTVQKLNKEMYEIARDTYELLLKNQEDNIIYNYDYSYKEEEGVIGIIITEVSTIQWGGGNIDYKCFYYDKRTDELLSFKEYLSVLGVDINDISSNPRVKEAYKNDGQEGSIVVLDAIIDSKSSVVCVKAPMSMFPHLIIESNTPIAKINLKNPFELYTGKQNEIVMTIGSKTAYVNSVAVENDVEPIIVNGRTMLPARFVAENLGATVEWENSSRKVTIKKGTIKIELFVDSNTAYVNGKEVILDSTVFIKNGRTYTPVRFIVETLESTIDWLNNTRQVVIYKNVSIADKLYEYYNENKKSFIIHDVLIPNAFLADLDEDCIPELCLSYGNGGYGDWLEIIKCKNGQIYSAGTFSGARGTGRGSTFSLIYDFSRNIFIWYEEWSVSLFNEKKNSSSYFEYRWRENDNITDYSLNISQDIDKYSYSLNGGEEIITTKEKQKSIVNEALARENKYIGNKIDIENCSFFEVWNHQKGKK